MREGEASERERLDEDYADACAAYDATSAMIVKRMQDANNALDAKPTAAEIRAEEEMRYRLVAARRRICQSGAQSLEWLPIG
jgi:hypothetical protein